MLSISRFAQLVAAVVLLPTLDPLGSGFDRSAATTEHLFEGAKWPQQIGADKSVVAGHGNLPDVRVRGVSAAR
jgi:hypothetical protein